MHVQKDKQITSLEHFDNTAIMPAVVYLTDKSYFASDTS